VTLPEKSRPVAIKPACGSVCVIVTHMTVGPVSVQLSMACPISVSRLPVQIFGKRYCCAVIGFGRWLTTMFNMALCNGMVSASCSTVFFW